MEPDRRIGALDLVKGARVIPAISDGDARLLGNLFCGVWWTVTLTLALLREWPGLLAFVSLGFLLTWFVAKPASGRVIAEVVHKYWTLPRDRPMTSIYATKGSRIVSADRIDPGKWVITQKEYLEKKHNASRPYPNGAPLVPYRLLVATFPVGGNKRAVVLSDGLHTEWYRQTNVIIKDGINALRGPGSDDRIQLVSEVFRRIIALLSEERRGVSISKIEEILGEGLNRQILQAVTAARFWNLIEVPDKERSRLKNRIHSESKIQLTEAGRYWHQALARDGGKKSVPKNRGRSQTTKIQSLTVNNGTLNFAGGDISDTHTTQTHLQPSDDQVLLWLGVILDSQDISWSGPELVSIRRVIETAVAEKNPQEPGLKTALKKLRSICGDVLEGMLGIGAYQLLQHFIA